MSKIIISDFDGVIGDSLEIAVSLTQKIVSLFNTKDVVKTFADYYKFFGRRSENRIVSTKEADTIRELHRILMRYHSNKINIFPNVIELYSNLSTKPIIVSSIYADVIENVLVGTNHNFQFIYGYESGHKKDILKELVKKYDVTYVTDTLRDIEICKKNNIPVIATCWGYDSKEELEVGNPDYLAKDLKELKRILVDLNFL